MSAISNGSLQPTWFGYVASARDALVLFEACLNGTLHHVPRRPHDRERAQLIKSGCVFIYEENASGIKRWTDGVPWSPSRILGNFLIYRELKKPFPPGEKKRANKKSNRSGRETKPGEPYPRNNGSGSPPSPTTPSQPGDISPEMDEQRRALVGSLVDSYGFKDDGLVKKTMSVNVHGVHHHLVSYYSVEDVMEQKLSLVSQDPRLASIEPRHDLVARQSFRAPLDDTEDVYSEQMSANNHHGYHYPHNGYNRPDLMMAYNGHPASMPMSHTPLNMSAPSFSAGIQSYTPPHPASQSYYTPSVPAPLRPDQHGSFSASPGYNVQRPPLSISIDRRTSLPQHPHQNYSYRQGPMTPQTARPALGSASHSQDGRPLENGSWDRAVTSATHGGIYGATAPPQPHSAGPFPTQTPHWGGVINQSHGLPQIKNEWGTNGDSSWGMDHNATNRHASYQATPPHNA